MGWLFVALSVLGFLWALMHHLRLTLINLGVIPPNRPGELYAGVSLEWAIGSAVATIRTIAWSIVLLVVEWPALVTWVVLVLAIALLLHSVLLFIFLAFDKSPDPQMQAVLGPERRKEVYGRLFGAFIGAVAFVVCVYKLGI